MHGLEIRVVRTVLSSLDEPRSGKRCGLVQVVKVKVDSYLHTKSDLYVQYCGLKVPVQYLVQQYYCRSRAVSLAVPPPGGPLLVIKWDIAQPHLGRCRCNERQRRSFHFQVDDFVVRKECGGRRSSETLFKFR